MCVLLQELILHPKPNTVISLGGNVAWLGMPSLATADLYVRSCYPELLEARELALNRQILRDAHCGGDARWREGCVNIFTGSSGGPLAADAFPCLDTNVKHCNTRANVNRGWKEPSRSIVCGPSTSERLNSPFRVPRGLEGRWAKAGPDPRV